MKKSEKKQIFLKKGVDKRTNFVYNEHRKQERKPTGSLQRSRNGEQAEGQKQIKNLEVQNNDPNELIKKSLESAGWVITDQTDEDGYTICQPADEAAE